MKQRLFDLVQKYLDENIFIDLENTPYRGAVITDIKKITKRGEPYRFENGDVCCIVYLNVFLEKDLIFLLDKIENESMDEGNVIEYFEEHRLKQWIRETSPAYHDLKVGDSGLVRTSWDEKKNLWRTVFSKMKMENVSKVYDKDRYTKSTYKSYLKLFLNNIEFAKQYISIHYPFEYNYLIENWSYLEAGDAYYCTFLSDIDSVYPSKFGLAYNKNIRWNSKLKARYEYGFENPYEGNVEGTGKEPVELDERDYLDSIIPLDVEKEIQCRDYASFLYWGSVIAPYKDENDEGPDMYETESLFKNFNYLKFAKFKTIFEKSKITALINDSIWENTLKFIIDESFCDKIIDELKKTK